MPLRESRVSLDTFISERGTSLDRDRWAERLARGLANRRSTLLWHLKESGHCDVAIDAGPDWMDAVRSLLDQGVIVFSETDPFCHRYTPGPMLLDE